MQNTTTAGTELSASERNGLDGTNRLSQFSLGGGSTIEVLKYWPAIRSGKACESNKTVSAATAHKPRKTFSPEVASRRTSLTDSRPILPMREKTT